MRPSRPARPAPCSRPACSSCAASRRPAPRDRAAASVLEGPDRRPRHRRDPGSPAQSAAPVRAHGLRLLGERPRRPRAARRPALERPRRGQGQPPRGRLLPAVRRRRATALRRQHRGPRLPFGAVDVVVTDGFTGNVVLKLLEGTGAWLFDEIRQAATSSWQGKLGGLLLRPKLRAAARQGQPRDIRRLVPHRPARDRGEGARRLGLGRDLQRAAPRGARSARRADRRYRTPRASGAPRRGYHRSAAHGYGRNRLTR